MNLILGDCLEKMKAIPDKSVNLLVCDLPYGCLTSQTYKGVIDKSGSDLGKTYGEQLTWDIKIDLKKFWIEVKRIVKDDHTPVLMFCNTKFGFDLYNSNPEWFRYDLVWNKNRGISFLSANKMPMKSHEMIYVFSKKGANYYRKDIEGEFKKWTNKGRMKTGSVYGMGMLGTNEGVESDKKRCALSVIQLSTTFASKGQHPTEKPIELYKFLIERYSKEGDVVLDTTFGSGNSGHASIELKRKYIGIEKDNNYFWKMVKSVNLLT